MNSKVENGNVLILERVFKVPRKLVFNMFKEAKHLKHWWGPKGWDLPVCNIDFRKGGVWHYCMKCTDLSQGEYYGMESWGKIVYNEIIEPELIRYTDYFSDADGNVDETLPASDTTLRLIEIEEGTKLVNRTTYASADQLQSVLDMGMLEGIKETWDRLEELLSNQTSE